MKYDNDALVLVLENQEDTKLLQEMCKYYLLYSHRFTINQGRVLDILNKIREQIIIKINGDYMKLHSIYKILDMFADRDTLFTKKNGDKIFQCFKLIGLIKIEYEEDE